MRSRPATVPASFLFEADRFGAQTVNHFDSSPDVGRDAYRLGSRDAAVGAGSVVIGILWLALYVMAVLYTPTSQHGELASTVPNITPADVAIFSVPDAMIGTAKTP
jgi:hypothetical protein